MNRNPKVSVIMATYNESIEHLSLAVWSVLNQTFTDFECIIVLDNPDNSEIAEYLVDLATKDSRVQIIKNESNIGLANSLNRALAISRGEYIARMDADDISLETRFEKQVAYLDTHDYCHVLATDRTDIDEQGNHLPTTHIVADHDVLCSALRYANVLTHPSIMMRKDFLERVGGYRDLKAAQDYELWVRMLKYGANFYILPEILLQYRIRQTGISKSNVAKQHLNTLYAQHLFKHEAVGEGLFNAEHMQTFLKKKQLLSDQGKDRYNKAYALFFGGLYRLKNENFIRGFFDILKAICTHKEILPFVLRSVKRDRILRGYIRVDQQ